jgi:glycosyltransferase involved in cell wall biosynthesis
MSMRIAHFVQRYPPALGGSEAYFARLSRHLTAAGHSVTVFTTTALDLEAFWRIRSRCLPAGIGQEDGVEVRRYGLWRFPGRRYWLKPLSLIPHRRWQCLTLPCNPIAWGMWTDAGRITARFDVIHASAFPYAWPIACGRRLAQRLRVPFLLTPFLHLGDPDDPGDRTRRAYTSPQLMSLVRDADRVFVQTASEQSALLSQGIAEEKLSLLGLGVEPAECTGGNRGRARAKWQVSKDEVVVGHLANNSIEKGTVDLLQAAERAWDQAHRFVVVLAGPEMPNFQRFWSRYRPAFRVHRLGILDDQEKRDFFAGIDVFSLPSRSDSFGLVLLEAWANALPNLAYRAGGVADLIRNDQDGILVRCGDIDALSAGLIRLVEGNELRKKLGSAGRERIPQEFVWKDKLDRVCAVYNQVVRENERRKQD